VARSAISLSAAAVPKKGAASAGRAAGAASSAVRRAVATERNMRGAPGVRGFARGPEYAGGMLMKAWFGGRKGFRATARRKGGARGRRAACRSRSDHAGKAGGAADWVAVFATGEPMTGPHDRKFPDA